MGDGVIVSTAIAFALAIVLGTPSWMPHPGRGLTWLVVQVFALFRKTKFAARTCSMLSILVIVLGTSISAWLILAFCGLVSNELYIIISIVLIYSSLSPGGLVRECQQVKTALEKNDRNEAGWGLSRMVGTAIPAMDSGDIARTTIEIAAERMVTDIVAPIFYALIGGAPFAIAYMSLAAADRHIKTVEPRYSPFFVVTENAKYCLDFIPSRFALLFLFFASWFNREDLRRSWTCVQRDGGLHLNPNVGLMKAALAGSLGIQLGGTNFFPGGTSTMPLIGEPVREIAVKDITRCTNMIYTTAVSAFLTGIVFRAFIAAFISLFFGACKTETVPVMVQGGAQIAGTWSGSWESKGIATSRGRFDCTISMDHGRWHLIGTIETTDKSITRPVEMWGNPASEVVKLDGQTDYGDHGTFVWSALCSVDSCRGTFKGKSDEGTIFLQKQ